MLYRVEAENTHRGDWLRGPAPTLEKEGLAVTEQGELLDSGYQMICMSGTLAHPRNVGEWLAEQLQWEANSKERITNIDSFQVIEVPRGWYGIAVCRITKQEAQCPTA